MRKLLNFILDRFFPVSGIVNAALVKLTCPNSVNVTLCRSTWKFTVTPASLGIVSFSDWQLVVGEGHVSFKYGFGMSHPLNWRERHLLGEAVRRWMEMDGTNFRVIDSLSSTKDNK